MFLKKGQLPILVVNIVSLTVFTGVVVSSGSYGLLSYVALIVLVLLVILATDKRIAYPNGLVWGLTLWALLHMLGGGVRIGDTTLYATIVIPLSKTYPILRYDQFVHMIGFGVATLLMHHLLKPLLKPDPRRWKTLYVVVGMAGMGVGALNELVEFAATQLASETGVGGYMNTCLDLVANMIGAILALVFLRIREERGW
jgi:putative membrane protein